MAVVSEHLRVRAAPQVRDLAAGYSGYRSRGIPAARHAGLPSPYLTVIFTLDDPLHVAGHPDPRAPAEQYLALVGGLHAAPALITHDGRQSGVQLAVSPLAARTLFGCPAGELAGLDVHAEQVIGPLAERVRQDLLAADGWAARFAVLDRLLQSRAAEATDRRAVQPAPELTRAWQRLIGTSGQVPVTDLAREVGWSTSYLNRKFRTELGLSPKVAAQVIRFDRARRELQRRVVADAGIGAGTGPGRGRGTGRGTGRGGHEGLGLARLAADTGYYDQAHLTRDFARFAGSPPQRWLAELS